MHNFFKKKHITWCFSFRRKQKPKAFTLLEMIIVMTAFFLLMVIIVQMYTKIVQIKYWVEARQTILQNSYYMIEKLNVELKDFGIDYEEYFNRKLVGCDGTQIDNNFVRDVDSNKANWYCDNFTAYGNQNSYINSDASRTPNLHKIYFCSSKTWYSWPDEVVIKEPNIQNGSWCFQALRFTTPARQAFWQYKNHFIDVKNDVDFLASAVNDNDDEDVWIWPKAIGDTKNIQELYFISQDKTERLLLRRALVASGDRDRNGIISGDIEHRYTLQMLRLKWFDAGENHNFDVNSPGLYDGKIDTRACDFSQGFICNGAPIDTTLYSGYNLPLDQNDGWVNLSEKNITLSDRGISIYPDTKWDYAWKQDAAQINPYIQLRFQSKLYGETRARRLWWSIDNFQITLQTTFNTRGVYTR